ncbi:glycosyltransferase [Flagellimonas marinaquae]
MNSKLKVLWFTNMEVNPQSVTSGLNAGGRGWLSTLASQIHQEIELHVVTVHHSKTRLKSEYLTNHYLCPDFYWLRRGLCWIFGEWDMEGDLTPAMLRVVEEVNPDLVHIHGSEKQFIKIIPHLNECDIPVLVSLQGVMSVIAKKFTAAYSKSFIRTFWYHGGMSKKSLFPMRLSIVFKQIKARAKREERLLKAVPYFAGRTFWDRSIAHLFNPRAVYFHVDRVLKPIYYKSCWSSDKVTSQVYTIHTTLSNSAYKGFDVIAEAAFLLEQSGLTFKWRVAGVTKRSWSVRAAKRKLGKRYPRHSLVLLGHLSADKLVESMLNAHQYASASYIENSPNNLAEALVLGLPCIATDVGGTSSYIENNRTGMLIPSGDPYALAGCIRSLAKDVEKREALGKQARKNSIRRHSPSAAKTALLEAYRAIIEGEKHLIESNPRAKPNSGNV